MAADCGPGRGRDGRDPERGPGPRSAGRRPRARDPQVGKSFQVPYRLTDTNHFLVRVRINGKGPFNFLVDSGAPALFVATETARKIGLKPADAATFWTPIDRLDIEGGARLSDVKARVEDPFQLVGMNALGLPGATIDGILGFTILGRFRLEIDLTEDRMTWTRLDYDPREPPVPRLKAGEEAEAPLGVQAMNALGPLAKGMAFLMGKQPEERVAPPRLPGHGVDRRPADRTRTGCGSVACSAARPPPGPASRPTTRSSGSTARPSIASRRRAPPWPTSGRATPSRCSSAAARAPVLREQRIIIKAGEGL